jgi:hypothetical protein
MATTVGGMFVTAGGFWLVYHMDQGPAPAVAKIQQGGGAPILGMPVAPPAGRAIEATLAADGTYRNNNVLVAGDPIDPARRLTCKIYEIRLEVGKAYVIDMLAGAPNFDPFLRLTDSNGIELAQDDDGGGNLNARINFTPQATGVFKIFASDLGGLFGPFMLSIRGAPTGPQPPIEVALDADGFYRNNNQLHPQDLADPARRTPCKVYHVRFEAGRSYLIDMESRQFDSYLRLTDGNGKTLAEDDDGGGNFNARIRFPAPTTGLYKVYATALAGRPVGDFGLTIRREAGAPLVVKKDEIPPKPAPFPVPPATESKIEAAVGADGSYRDTNRLMPGDFPDPEFRTPCKVYQVRLEAGFTYIFELRSLQFDAYLRLSNLAGTPLARDDDDGGGLNARIRFQPPSTGLYKIYATALKGPPPMPAPVGVYVLSIRRETATPLAEKKTEVPVPPPVEAKVPPSPPVEAKVTPPPVEAKIKPPPTETKVVPPPIGGAAGPPMKKGEVTYRELRIAPGPFGSLCWDATGKALFQVSVSGTISRFRLEDFTLEKQQKLPSPGWTVSLTGEGLLVQHPVRPDDPTLSVVEPETLQVKSRFKVPLTSTRVFTSPALSFALLEQKNRFTALDLKTGEVMPVAVQGLPSIGEPLYTGAVLTPDGKYLFVPATNFEVHRLRLVEGRLVREESLRTKYKLSSRLCITPDSKYVCVYPNGVLNPKGAETTFYPVERFKPAFSLPETARPMAVDAQSVVYAQQSRPSSGFVAYAPLGPGAQPHDLSWDGGPVTLLLPLPQGNAFLIAGGGGRLFLGELAAAK